MSDREVNDQQAQRMAHRTRSQQDSPVGRHENGSRHGSYREESPRASPRRERSRSGSRSKAARKRNYSRSSRERPVDDYRSDRGRRGSREDGRGGRSAAHSQPDRENPQSGRCLGVFGLSIYTQESDLKDILGKYGHIEDVQIVYDAQTGRSRGFAFVYFEQERDAAVAKDRCNGIEIDGRKIRVDFSITQRAHTPTPGIYMGKPTRRREGRPTDAAPGGSSRGGGRPREREDYRHASYAGAGGDYARREEYRPPPPRDSYSHHSDPYASSSRAPPPLPSRGYEDRYSSRDNGYSRRRSPSPYFSSRSASGRYRERSRSYSPRKYYY